jgi:hypothetical protein
MSSVSFLIHPKIQFLQRIFITHWSVPDTRHTLLKRRSR